MARQDLSKLVEAEGIHDPFALGPVQPFLAAIGLVVELVQQSDRNIDQVFDVDALCPYVDADLLCLARIAPKAGSSDRSSARAVTLGRRMRSWGGPGSRK